VAGHAHEAAVRRRRSSGAESNRRRRREPVVRVSPWCGPASAKVTKNAIDASSMRS
jgi:hypothetical protein